MISNASTANAYSYTMSGRFAAGKLYVPVKPSLVVYSQFEHVAGYADADQTAGVPITKVHILNTLIDQLVSAKQKPISHTKAFGLDDKQIDALIETYQTQLQSAVAAAQTNPFAKALAVPSTGAILNIRV